MALRVFVLGLVCVTVGTGLMFDFVGGLTFDVHGISGLIAILLMLIHAVWALIALLKQDESVHHTFHPPVQRFRVAGLAHSLLSA